MKHLRLITVVRPQPAQFGPLLELIALIQSTVNLVQQLRDLGKVPKP